MSSWYRPIDAGLWGDEKFRRLTGPQPCAKYLWIYLLTGDHTDGLPGLYRLGEAALAEALEWPVEDLRRVLSELVEAGMVQVDLRARVIHLPNALKYQQPRNPDHMQGLAKAFGRIPECHLKRVWLAQLAEWASTRDKAGYVAVLRADYGVNPDMTPTSTRGPMPTMATGMAADMRTGAVSDVVSDMVSGGRTTSVPSPNTRSQDQRNHQQEEVMAPRLFECHPEPETGDEIPFAVIVGYLNERAGKRFRHTTDDTRRHIRARWREGYRVPEFKTVIDTKCASWGGTEREVFLRPQTLFGPKFDGYLNEQSTIQPETGGLYPDLD